MSNEQAKLHGKKHGGKSPSDQKNDYLYYGAAVAAIVVVLAVLPKLLGALGLSFLAAGAGLNKLFSVAVAVAAGWFCLKPAQGYKDFIELSKGARTEWRKTVKPDRDTVVRTTMMVLALMVVFALLVLLLDWFFGAIVRLIVG
ncbi:MAG: preprotein translocase subunit SecE [Gammaproteobacteria bacterium]|nr:MAG: preprotein translocase subunit SecE [Gammaproteobacteria bacterium]